MVENNYDLRDFKGLVKNDKKEILAEKNITLPDSVLLFFSFDIVNSSIYKTINNYSWSNVINFLLTSVREEVEAKISNAEVWRILGDEIIFIVNIHALDDVYNYVDSIYAVLVDLCEKIDDERLFNEDKKIKDLNLSKTISLQSCAWIAAVTDKSSIESNENWEYAENIFEIIESHNNKFYEFIGIDIDTGFRLREQTKAQRLTLSFELAYLLKEKSDCVKNLNIIAYRKLKGVWNNCAYPIIWYYDPVKHNNVKFARSMPFDAIEQDEIYVEFFSKKKFADYMYRDVKSALNKIYRDRKLEKKIEHIKQLIDNNALVLTRFINDSKLELHCAVVCCDEKKGMFIAQRSEKDLLPKMWEFGCVKAKHTSNLVETIKEGYLADFGLSIELFIDKDREDKQPIPLAMYEVNKNGELHKGVIFLAKIVNTCPNVKLNDKKHIDCMFVNKNDVDMLESKLEGNYVPDFIDTLKKAFIKIEEIQNE